MKKSIHKIPESEILKRYPIKGKIPGWYFSITEKSNNAFWVEGMDQWGRKIYRQGGDPDQLLEDVISDALQLLNEDAIECDDSPKSNDLD